MFQKINRSLWKREEYFSHYISTIPCTYSITTKLDITNLKNQKLSLYPTMLYLLSKTVNAHDEFRMAIDKNGDVGIYDTLYPCYTIFHKNSETFSDIWTEYNDNYTIFCQNYQNDISKYGTIEKMIAKPNIPENTFPVSMIPWVTFDGFNLNLKKGYDYLLPIFTMSKFEFTNKQYLLPLSIQVHHAVCDGFHISRFVNELQATIHHFKP